KLVRVGGVGDASQVIDAQHTCVMFISTPPPRHRIFFPTPKPLRNAHRRATKRLVAGGLLARPCASPSATLAGYVPCAPLAADHSDAATPAERRRKHGLPWGEAGRGCQAFTAHLAPPCSQDAPGGDSKPPPRPAPFPPP